jgi:predicted transcriptional regulator
VFKALANQRRMIIIKLLAKRSRSVIEISNIMGISFKSCSKHLLKLEREGVASKKQDGRYVVYSLIDSFKKSGVCKQIIESY